MHWTLFDNNRLLPKAWRDRASGSGIWCFNPGLQRTSEGCILAYRVVRDDGDRRICACRLADDFSVIEGTQTAISDHIKFWPGAELSERARNWFADPRLYAIDGRLFMYFNSGWHAPRNHQFLIELDPQSLCPVGFAWELDLVTPIQALEKNWTFLDTGADALFGALVYSPSPHRIARLVDSHKHRLIYSLDAEAAPVSASRLGPGQLRGGAPPVRQGDCHYSFCHFIPDTVQPVNYRAAVYRFDSRFPHTPHDDGAALLVRSTPPDAARGQPALNPAVNEVIYPGGAIWHAQTWHIACGLNDERCGILSLSRHEVDSLWTRGSAECMDQT